MFLENIPFPTGDAQPVRGDLYCPAARPNGLVVLCHGFKGYKTWGFFPYLGDTFRDHGMAALVIDFSHNGTYPDLETGETARATGTNGRPEVILRAGGTAHGGAHRYVRPDLFKMNTLRREYEDLSCVLRHVETGRLARELGGPVPVGLFGHSRGGVAATLCAIDHPVAQVLCTWSTCDDPDFYTRVQKKRWRKEGGYRFTVASDGTVLELGVGYLDDLEEHHDVYHLARRVAGLRVPHLIVQGTLDMAVKVDGAIKLHEAERHLADKRLVLLQTGHTFGLLEESPAPLERPSAVPGGRPHGVPEALLEAARETVVWFDTHFRKGSRP